MQSISCYFAEKTFMDCWKVIYENIEKKKKNFTTNISIYTSHTGEVEKNL